MAFDPIGLHNVQRIKLNWLVIELVSSPVQFDLQNRRGKEQVESVKSVKLVEEKISKESVKLVFSFFTLIRNLHVDVALHVAFIRTL